MPLLPLENPNHSLYVVFDHPSDYPDEFVVRRTLVSSGVAVPDSELWARAPTLAAVRLFIPSTHKYRLPPDASDDDTIAETWIALELGQLLHACATE
jgi:hypothetical protein